MKNACRSLAVVALLALVATATAGIRRMAPETVRKQVEVTMLLTGTIDIEHDGSVSGYALDQPEKVPDYVASLLDRRVAAWQFEPTVHDGRAVAVRSPMSRSEEHTSELQSLMRTPYAVFCLKKQSNKYIQHTK